MLIGHSAIDNNGSTRPFGSRANWLDLLGIAPGHYFSIMLVDRGMCLFFFFSGFKACCRTHNSLSRNLRATVLMLGEIRPTASWSQTTVNNLLAPWILMLGKLVGRWKVDVPCAMETMVKIGSWVEALVRMVSCLVSCTSKRWVQGCNYSALSS